MSLSEQYDKIYKYCYFKVKNAHLAEDLTQETFLRFFEQNSYISRGKPLAYLYTIAKNLCIDLFSKAHEQPLPEDAAAPDKVIDALEMSIAIKTAVATLPNDLQELLLLRFSNELLPYVFLPIFAILVSIAMLPFAWWAFRNHQIG